MVVIADPETAKLADRLAERTGEPVSVSVRNALLERLARLDRDDARAKLVADLTSIAAVCAAGSPGDARTDDEIIGYGPTGHFG